MNLDPDLVEDAVGGVRYRSDECVLAGVVAQEKSGSGASLVVLLILPVLDSRLLAMLFGGFRAGAVVAATGTEQAPCTAGVKRRRYGELVMKKGLRLISAVKAGDAAAADDCRVLRSAESKRRSWPGFSVTALPSGLRRMPRDPRQSRELCDRTRRAISIQVSARYRLLMIHWFASSSTSTSGCVSRSSSASDTSSIGTWNSRKSA